MLKWINKYWFLISIIFTILSSCATGVWMAYNKFDALNDKVNDTNQWVQDHDDELKALHDDNIKLKEDERLREAGLLK